MSIALRLFFVLTVFLSLFSVKQASFAASDKSPSAMEAPLSLSERDQATLVRIETYLNSFTTLTANFVQESNTGEILEGRLFWQKPGKMRFEYAPSAQILLVSNGETVMYRDDYLDQTSFLSIEDTPLSFLVRAQIRLQEMAQITAFEYDPQRLRLTFQPKLEQDSSSATSSGQDLLTLVFMDHPLILQQWIVRDAQNRQTRVTLTDMLYDTPLKSSLFSIAPRIREQTP